MACKVFDVQHPFLNIPIFFVLNAELHDFVQTTTQPG